MLVFKKPRLYSGDEHLILNYNGHDCHFRIGTVWDGLIGLHYIWPDENDPVAVFRYGDIWADTGEIKTDARPIPVYAATGLLRHLEQREALKVSDFEEIMAKKECPASANPDTDLMLRGTLAGVGFSPALDQKPLGGLPQVSGYVMTPLSASRITLEVRDGLPVLTDDARAALRRDLKLPG